ncbi:unnamed protein product [Didymodactylos carnosus]|uniref:CCHC-type domain-containing protein n=1 Tax=Didymodactylos carnosus TaxID=1234261 RepID=A0A8S2S8Q2_9BILA|nr:unnamed protein product [Didymodactylos carnosus]CAF4212823.1 unnamed protein product [Didymodactylos carnosus]
MLGLRQPVTSEMVGNALNLVYGNDSMMFYNNNAHNVDQSGASFLSGSPPFLAYPQFHQKQFLTSNHYNLGYHNQPMSNVNHLQAHALHRPWMQQSTQQPHAAVTNQSSQGMQTCMKLQQVNATSDIEDNGRKYSDDDMSEDGMSGERTNKRQKKSAQMASGINGVTLPVSTASNLPSNAVRYGETRYAFPPFIVVLDRHPQVDKIKDELCLHFADKHNIKLEFEGIKTNYRQAMIFFVKNRESFICLFDAEKWPVTLGGLNFKKTLPRRLPPQFSLVLHDVSLSKNIDELLNEMQLAYPDIDNAFRINNKEKKPTKLVRIDIRSVKTLNDLVQARFMYIDYVRYRVSEYIAPVKVLLCSKCFGIGHFKRECKQDLPVCKVCGLAFQDLELHRGNGGCSGVSKCVRCQGSHASNDGRCPSIITYRAALTKTMLPVFKSNKQMNQLNQFNQNDNDFPKLGSSSNALNVWNQTAHNDNLNSLAQKVNSMEILIVKIADMQQQISEQQVLIQEQQQMILQQQSDQQKCVTFCNSEIMKINKKLAINEINVNFHQNYIFNLMEPMFLQFVELAKALQQKNIIKDNGVWDKIKQLSDHHTNLQDQYMICNEQRSKLLKTLSNDDQMLVQ